MMRNNFSAALSVENGFERKTTSQKIIINSMSNWDTFCEQVRACFDRPSDNKLRDLFVNQKILKKILTNLSLRYTDMDDTSFTNAEGASAPGLKIFQRDFSSNIKALAIDEASLESLAFYGKYLFIIDNKLRKGYNHLSNIIPDLSVIKQSVLNDSNYVIMWEDEFTTWLGGTQGCAEYTVIRDKDQLSADNWKEFTTDGRSNYKQLVKNYLSKEDAIESIADLEFDSEFVKVFTGFIAEGQKTLPMLKNVASLELMLTKAAEIDQVKIIDTLKDIPLKKMIRGFKQRFIIADTQPEVTYGLNKFSNNTPCLLQFPRGCTDTKDMVKQFQLPAGIAYFEVTDKSQPQIVEKAHAGTENITLDVLMEYKKDKNERWFPGIQHDTEFQKLTDQLKKGIIYQCSVNNKIMLSDVIKNSIVRDDFVVGEYYKRVDVNYETLKQLEYHDIRFVWNQSNTDKGYKFNVIGNDEFVLNLLDLCVETFVGYKTIDIKRAGGYENRSVEIIPMKTDVIRLWADWVWSTIDVDHIEFIHCMNLLNRNSSLSVYTEMINISQSYLEHLQLVENTITEALGLAINANSLVQLGSLIKGDVLGNQFMFKPMLDALIEYTKPLSDIEAYILLQGLKTTVVKGQ
jgi:hypothetical protein